MADSSVGRTAGEVLGLRGEDLGMDFWGVPFISGASRREREGWEGEVLGFFFGGRRESPAIF